jgi:hypothetical protein
VKASEAAIIIPFILAELTHFKALSQQRLRGQIEAANRIACILLCVNQSTLMIVVLRTQASRQHPSLAGMGHSRISTFLTTLRLSQGSRARSKNNITRKNERVMAAFLGS